MDAEKVILRLKKSYEQEIKIWQYALEKIDQCKSSGKEILKKMKNSYQKYFSSFSGIDNSKDECRNAHEFCLCKNKVERNEHAYSRSWRGIKKHVDMTFLKS